MFQIDFNSPDLNEICSAKLKLHLPPWEKEIWLVVSQLLDDSVTNFTVFTSGSTGKPKQIVHTRQALLNSAKMTCHALQLKQANAALLCLPADKIGGMMIIARCFINKMILYCIQPSANPLVSLNNDIHFDLASFTPMQINGIIKYPELFNRANDISKILLGGQDISPALQQAVTGMSNQVYATFGMTETVSHIALKRLNGPNADKYFKTQPGIKINTDDRNCLVIEAPELGQPHLVTNDIIHQISATEFEWLGRYDNVINTGGIKIYPEMVEQQLAVYISLPFFIAGMPDEKTGEKPVIAVEAEKLSNIQIQQITHALNQLEKYHRPKEILLIPHFLKTENNKLLRAQSLGNSVQTIAL
jgi:O-succinylbenzoic acid--CoA ligase